jgi:hypothetical protein
MSDDQRSRDDKLTHDTRPEEPAAIPPGTPGVLGIQETLPATADRQALRAWWHGLRRDHDRYACYAIFLVLPSDSEAIKYVTEYDRELHLISAENCLVIALGKAEFKRSGYESAFQSAPARKPISAVVNGIWARAIRKQIHEGYSVTVAQLFDIRFEEFPCVAVFRDIRTPEHIVITLKGRTVAEIADAMRTLFSTIQKAISTKQDPLVAIQTHRNEESFRSASRSLVSGLRSLAGRTFETAMDSLIKAQFK